VRPPSTLREFVLAVACITLASMALTYLIDRVMVAWLGLIPGRLSLACLSSLTAAGGYELARMVIARRRS